MVDGLHRKAIEIDGAIALGQIEVAWPRFASERSGQIGADGLVPSSLVFAGRTTGPFLDSDCYEGSDGCGRYS
jgi:hypothetical protein